MTTSSKFSLLQSSESSSSSSSEAALLFVAPSLEWLRKNKKLISGGVLVIGGSCENKKISNEKRTYFQRCC
jgi:hypothetical protein